MRRPRVSIAALMIVVLVVAVGTAALKVADEVWAGAMLTLTVGLLGVAVLGALFRRESRRAFCVGFALFAASYLAPSIVEVTRPKLPTTKLLAHAHAKLAPDDGPVLSDASFLIQVTRQNNGVVALDLGMPAVQSAPVTTSNGPTTSGTTFLFKALATGTTPEHFVTVGHCLLALATGLLGGLIARAFYNAERARAGVGGP
jgi:hypothetical protein